MASVESTSRGGSVDTNTGALDECPDPTASTEHAVYQDYADKDLRWVLHHRGNAGMGPKAWFPTRLHEMVEACSASPSLSAIMSWLPHGRAFQVHNRRRFTSDVLPRYFVHQGAYDSFQRQLNKYDFVVLPRNHEDGGAYYHPLFLRGRLALCELLVRRPKQAQRCQRRLLPSRAPDFYCLPPVLEPTLAQRVWSPAPLSNGPDVVSNTETLHGRDAPCLCLSVIGGRRHVESRVQPNSADDSIRFKGRVASSASLISQWSPTMESVAIHTDSTSPSTSFPINAANKHCASIQSSSSTSRDIDSDGTYSIAPVPGDVLTLLASGHGSELSAARFPQLRSHTSFSNAQHGSGMLPEWPTGLELESSIASGWSGP